MRIIQIHLRQLRMISQTPTRKMILMTAQMKHQVLREIINLRERYQQQVGIILGISSQMVPTLFIIDNVVY